MSTSSPGFQPPRRRPDFMGAGAVAEPTTSFGFPLPVAPLAAGMSVSISPTPAEEARPVVPETPRLTIDFDKLYVAITQGASRPDAMVKMSEWLSQAIPGINVRCGIGTTRLRRFFDSRLGWLGAESVLQREMAGIWSQFIAQDTTPDPDPKQLIICLRNPRSTGMLLLSLTGDRLPSDLLDQFRKHQDTLAALFWTRPAYALPEWSTTRGRPRIALVLAAVTLAVLMIFPVPYRTNCTLRVEPTSGRIVTAPFEAVLESVSVEPGDTVKQGQVLATLEGRTLRLELQAIEAEIQQSEKQQDVNIATGRIADAQLAQLKRQQLGRQHDLLLQRLEQLQIVSPLDGVIVSGDLRRSVGMPLEIGKSLFEIAPLERVLVEIEIPESEIAMIPDGAVVQLRVDAARSGTIDGSINKIYPAAQLRDGQSVFIAPVEMMNEDNCYRPGMRGKATIYGPVRPWAWTYLRGAIEQFTWLVGL